LKENFKVLSTGLDKKLVDHQTETEKQYTKLMDKNQKKVDETIQQIETYLQSIVVEQESVSNEFSTEFLDALSKEKAELDDEVKKIIKSTQDGYDEYKGELITLNKNKEKLITIFNEKISNSEEKFNKLLKKKQKDEAIDEHVKEHVRNILAVIVDLKENNINYQGELNKIQNKGLNNALKDKNSVIKNLEKVTTTLNNKIISLHKNLGKRIGAIVKEFGTKMQELSSKSDLISIIQDLMKEFDSFGKKFFDNLSKYKKVNNDVLKKGLNGIIELNNEAFSSFDKELEDDVADFVFNLEKYTMTNLEKMKIIATEIITEKTELATLDIPEFDEVFKNLINIFEDNIKETQNKYQKIITENYGPLFSSVDDIISKIKTDISHFESEQKKLLDVNITSHNKFLEVINNTYNSQFKEFEDRIDADINSLVDANQEIIGRIMVKTAETGSVFYDKSVKTSKKSEQAIESFLSDLRKSMVNFTNDFNETTDRIKDLIIIKLTQTAKK